MIRYTVPMSCNFILWPARVLASGWWYGRYWIMLADGIRSDTSTMFWFDTALEALVFLGDLSAAEAAGKKVEEVSQFQPHQQIL